MTAAAHLCAGDIVGGAKVVQVYTAQSVHQPQDLYSEPGVIRIPPLQLAQEATFVKLQPLPRKCPGCPDCSSYPLGEHQIQGPPFLMMYFPFEDVEVTVRV